jgi:hypothetical protein
VVAIEIDPTLKEIEDIIAQIPVTAIDLQWAEAEAETIGMIEAVVTEAVAERKHAGTVTNLVTFQENALSQRKKDREIEVIEVTEETTTRVKPKDKG